MTLFCLFLEGCSSILFTIIGIIYYSHFYSSSLIIFIFNVFWSIFSLVVNTILFLISLIINELKFLTIDTLLQNTSIIELTTNLPYPM
jgi:hypothetical protein